IADSAEPKSIEEIHRMRIRIGATVKGKDSINSGISTMQSVNLKVTKRSINIIKELRNYRWATDKNGKSINVPIDDFNHAIDGIRYVFLVKANKPSGKIAISTTHGHY
ncbi:MAG: terminase large subunit, partial [Bacteroidota bacterium]